MPEVPNLGQYIRRVVGASGNPSPPPDEESSSPEVTHENITADVDFETSGFRQTFRFNQNAPSYADVRTANWPDIAARMVVLNAENPGQENSDFLLSIAIQEVLAEVPISTDSLVKYLADRVEFLEGRVDFLTNG